MRVTSIFNSIDGEVNKKGQGCFTTFIRLAQCNLRCSYCDTKYSQKADQGKEMTIAEVYSAVERIGCKKVTITGGEPLLQMESLSQLSQMLSEADYFISVETNGSLEPSGLCANNIIMDWKLSSSGMDSCMKDNHFLQLNSGDYVKFIIGDVKDYNEAFFVKKRLQALGCKATFAFSPMWGSLDPKVLFEWLQSDKLFDSVLNLQLHKVIWPNVSENEEH